MPKIPEYNSPVVETQITSGALANPNAGAFGAELGGALRQVATGIDQFQQRVDATAAEDALVKFEREKNALFFDPEQGYFNSQGRDAYENAGSFAERLDKLRDDYATSLTSERARQEFTRVAEQHVTRGKADIMRHASKNLQAWEVATINAQVENTLENAVAYWNDHERLAVQRELGRQSILDAAALEGIDGDALRERLETYESSFAKSAISAAIAHGAEPGRAALDRYGDRLEGPDRLAMDGALAKREQQERTQAQSQMAVLTATRLVKQYGDLDGARTYMLEEVNKIEDPALRRETMREMDYQWQQKQNAESEYRASTFETAESFIHNGGSVEAFKAANPDGWERLSTKQKRILESGANVVTNEVLLADLLLLDDDKLAHVNPNDYIHELDSAARAKLTSAVRSARSGSIENSVTRGRVEQTNAIIRQIYGAAPTGGYKGKKLEAINSFHKMVNDEVAYRQELKGAKLTSEEYTDVLNGMTRKLVRERRILWDQTLDLTDIPHEHLDALSDHLRELGVPVTADNLIRAYEQATQQE